MAANYVLTPEQRERKLARNRERWRENAEANRAKARERYYRDYALDGERIRERRRRRYATGADNYMVAVRWERKYGLSDAEYHDILAAQGGGCGICGRQQPGLAPVTGKPRRLVVDHDHATGVVRGLLCTPCNSGIGMLGDQPQRLRVAADYLEGDWRTRHGLSLIHI